MKRILLFLLIAFGLVACSSATPTSLSPTEFQKLTEQPGVVVLDVRTPQEFAQGHLPNAVNMDVESADFGQKIATLDAASTYAVYCRSGNRSKVAMEQMNAAGIDKAQDLEGGIVAWQNAGLPVVI